MGANYHDGRHSHVVIGFTRRRGESDLRSCTRRTGRKAKQLVVEPRRPVSTTPIRSVLVPVAALFYARLVRVTDRYVVQAAAPLGDSELESRVSLVTTDTDIRPSLQNNQI